MSLTGRFCALIPFLLEQRLLSLLVLFVLQLPHIGETAGESSRAPVKPVSNEQIVKMLEQMIILPPPPDPQ
jgi:hypothetical protein